MRCLDAEMREENAYAPVSVNPGTAAAEPAGFTRHD